MSHAEAAANAPTPTVLVVRPDPLCPLDRFAPWLADEGLAVQDVSLAEGDELPESLTVDGLIVLGGEMSCLDDEHYPWLEDVRGLFRDAVDHGKPVFGICLGAQLMAQAFGGKVAKGESGFEDGVITVRRTQAGGLDPLFFGLPEEFPVACSHEDVITDLPAEAVWLATGALYPHQAFRLGPLAWAVQFHPEVSPQTYQGWLERMERQAPGAFARKRRGLEQVRSRVDEVVPHAEHLARRFARVVKRRVAADLADRDSGAPGYIHDKEAASSSSTDG